MNTIEKAVDIIQSTKSKALVRNIIRKLRLNGNLKENDLALRSLNSNLLEFLIKNQNINIDNSKVGFFYPTKLEPHIFPVINYLYNKQGFAILPLVLGDKMEFRIIQRQLEGHNIILKDRKQKHINFKCNTLIFQDLLKESQFKGILEPEDNTPKCEKLDIVIVPGMCFNIEGYRIGYGGGYYDKFLREHKDCIKVGIVNHNMILNSIPTDQWDVPVDFIITKNSILKCKLIANEDKKN